MIFVTGDIHDYFYSYICCPYVLCFGCIYTTMNRVSLLTKGVWFSEDACEGSPTQILIYCSSQLVIFPTEPSAWRCSWDTPRSPSEAGALPGWNVRTKDDVLGPPETLQKVTSPCKAQQLFVARWNRHPRTSLDILRNHWIFSFNSGTQKQLLMTQKASEWTVGMRLLLFLSDAPKDTRTSPERLQGEHFSLFRNLLKLESQETTIGQNGCSVSYLGPLELMKTFRVASGGQEMLILTRKP